MAYTSLYTDSPWQALSLSLELLDKLLEQLVDQSLDEEADLNSAIKRLGGIILDETGEPPILLPVASAPLIGEQTLLSIAKINLDELDPDLEQVRADLGWLQSIEPFLSVYRAISNTLTRRLT